MYLQQTNWWKSVLTVFPDQISINQQPPSVYHSSALISSVVKYVDHGLRVLFLYVTLVLQPSILHRWNLKVHVDRSLRASVTHAATLLCSLVSNFLCPVLEVTAFHLLLAVPKSRFYPGVKAVHTQVALLPQVLWLKGKQPLFLIDCSFTGLHYHHHVLIGILLFVRPIRHKNMLNVCMPYIKNRSCK